MFLHPRKAPAPTPTPETLPFWQAAAQGKLLVRACKACGQTHYYPRSICPHCLSADTEWRESSGKGSIYSYSVMRRAETPYVIAYVALDEGPIMMSNIVDCDLGDVAIGTRVELVFKPTAGDYPLPMFRALPRG
jgi:uncharacterized OB-fold protein